MNSTNALVSNACNIALNGSGSDVCQSINFVCSQYKFEKESLHDQLPFCQTPYDDSIMKCAEFVLDLLYMRRSYPCEEPYLRDIIHHICVC